MKTLATVLTLLLVPCALLSAQMDEREPGIYALVDSTSIHLSFLYGKCVVENMNLHGVEFFSDAHRFKGVTSGMVADSTFVLVIDPTKKDVTRKMKVYDPFIRNMTPDKMMVVPLTLNSEEQYREYCPGMKMDVLRVEKSTKIPFDWKKAGGNSFEICVHGLVPGEYAIIFRPVLSDGYDFNAIFGFTIRQCPMEPVE